MNEIGLQIAKFEMMKALIGNQQNDVVSTSVSIEFLVVWSPMLLKNDINVFITVDGHAE